MPCAIGATPSPFDANGALPLFTLPSMQTTCREASSCHLGQAMVEQPVSNAGGTNDQQHAISKQQAAYINKQQPAASPLVVNSQRIHMLCTHASSDSNIWNAFLDEVETDDEQAKSTPLRTVPLGKQVKVL